MGCEHEKVHLDNHYNQMYQKSATIITVHVSVYQGLTLISGRGSSEYDIIKHGYGMTIYFSVFYSRDSQPGGKGNFGCAERGGNFTSSY